MININSPEFKALQKKLNAKSLKLFAANNEFLVKKFGGQLSVFCPFSKNQLFTASTLQEVADHFKIGSEYD